MADIKTRDVVKGSIKKLDKAAIAADRMRSRCIPVLQKAAGGDISPAASRIICPATQFARFHRQIPP